jgi:hypothetical protein
VAASVADGSCGRELHGLTHTKRLCGGSHRQRIRQRVRATGKWQYNSNETRKEECPW